MSESLGLYILIGQTPVLEPDLLAWADWFGTWDRIVFQTEIPGGLVSTVFLGVDHNHSSKGPPLLFETMVWRGGEPHECSRCSTWLDAEAQHWSVAGKILGKRVSPPNPK